MVPTMVDVARAAARRPLQVPRINWMEIAAGWALAVALQLVLLFLGFGLGVGAIDFRAAGEELRQQVLSALAADHAASLNRSISSSRGSSRVANVLPDQARMARRMEAGQDGSMMSHVLDHAGPVVFWLAVWGVITWIASMFHPQR